MKRRIYILLTASILLVMAIFVFSKSKKIRDLEDILDEGRLTVLIESGVYGFAKDSTHVYGFQYEIIKDFADSLGVELLIIKQENIKNANKMLAKSACDVLVSLKPIIIDSTALIISTVPIISTRLVLVQHVEDNIIRKQYELDGDTLYTYKNSSLLEKLTYLSDDLAIDFSILEIPDVNTADLVEMVSERKIKLTFCPEYLVSRFKVDYPNLNFSLALSFPFNLAWTVNTESVELYNKLNEFLTEYTSSPKYQELKEKYAN